MRGLVVVGLLSSLFSVACGSSAPPSGQGGATGSGGSDASGGAAGGSAGGSDGGMSCPARSATNLPTKINLNDECAYVGTGTAGCAPADFEYDCPDNGLAIPPEAGCTHPTSGANPTLRWCCASALCSRFFSRDAHCTCPSPNPNDYNCAPGATAAAACAKNASGDYCCPFTD
jgi:hypothetical protein